LVGKESNRDGTGARIYVHTNEGMQMREAQSGSSYRSSSAAWQMFGLGEVSLIDALVVYWPSGKKQVLWNVETNQIVTVRED
ncbi:MAG: ASPIC/UnbV domain-containing protein, partial [bacterium]|nr:ASPIC/UnbV domain-containing protein [bacterium]